MASAKKILLCDFTHTAQTVAMNRMPLGIGMVGAYSQEKFGDKIRVKLYKFIDEFVDEFTRDPDVMLVGFSNFVWNQNINDEVCKRIKKVNPNVITVYGATNFPSEKNRQYAYLDKRTWLDFYIPHEGEEGFAQLLGLLLENNSDVDKVKAMYPKHSAYMYHSKLYVNPSLPRINIADIPSPYLMGLFDHFFKVLKPLVQMTRGCPFSCTFCTEGMRVWNKVKRRRKEIVEKEFEYIASRTDPAMDLFIADSNFGMYKEDIEFCNIIANMQDKYSWPKYIHVATGKNNKERVVEAAKTVRGGIRLSASVQSTDDKVLENIKRKNLPYKKIIEISQSFNDSGANSYSELITALPGDSKTAHLQTIKDILDSDVMTVRPYTTMLLEGTELDTEESKNKFSLEHRYRVLPRCFGRYTWPGQEDILIPEIEKVCVANKTMTFEEYIDCRCFDLTVDIFYNDGILMELYDVLSYFDISKFDYLLEIDKNKRGMGGLFNEFRREAREEVWESPEEIIDFFQEPGVYEKYREGIYGATLMFKYKSMAYFNHMDVVLDNAYKIAIDMISKNTMDIDSLKIKDFIAQLKRYNFRRVTRILDTSIHFEDSFDYDFSEFGAADGGFYKIYSHPRKTRFVFVHNPKQKEIIEYSKRFFGQGVVGSAAMLAQVYIKKCFREAKPVAAAVSA